jgi:hypothetical protein
MRFCILHGIRGTQIGCPKATMSFSMADWFEYGNSHFPLMLTGIASLDAVVLDKDFKPNVSVVGELGPNEFPGRGCENCNDARTCNHLLGAISHSTNRYLWLVTHDTDHAGEGADGGLHASGWLARTGTVGRSVPCVPTSKLKRPLSVVTKKIGGVDVIICDVVALFQCEQPPEKLWTRFPTQADIVDSPGTYVGTVLGNLLPNEFIRNYQAKIWRANAERQGWPPERPLPEMLQEQAVHKRTFALAAFIVAVLTGDETWLGPHDISPRRVLDQMGDRSIYTRLGVFIDNVVAHMAATLIRHFYNERVGMEKDIFRWVQAFTGTSPGVRHVISQPRGYGEVMSILMEECRTCLRLVTTIEMMTRYQHDRYHHMIVSTPVQNTDDLMHLLADTFGIRVMHSMHGDGVPEQHADRSYKNKYSPSVRRCVHLAYAKIPSLAEFTTKRQRLR